MPKYKLVITHEIESVDLDSAKCMAHILIHEVHQHGSSMPEAALLRDGDRSGANLLAPIPGSNHYKHGKVPLVEACPDWPTESWNKDLDKEDTELGGEA